MRSPDQEIQPHSPDWGRKLTAAGVAGTVLLGSLAGFGKGRSFDVEAKMRTAPIHNIQPGGALPDIGHDLPSAEDLLALAGTTHAKTEATTARVELLQNEPTPKEVQKLIRYNAAWVEGAGCSAWLLRNDRNQVVGAEFVAHCGFLPNQADRYKVGNTNYVVKQHPLKLKIGNRYKKTVGEIDQVLAPNEYTSENIIASVKGHSLKEALKVAKEQKMTKAEMAEMRVGDPVYSAGNPVDSKKPGWRHTTVGHVLTFGKANTSAGTHNINTLWVSNTSNKDGAEPSPGYSGSGVLGRVKSTGKYKMVGNVFGWEDFSGQVVVDPGSSNSTIQLPGAITSASAIDIDSPVAGKEATALRVVRSKEQIKGLHTTEKAIKRAEQAFYDPNAYKVIVDGVTRIDAENGWVDGVTVVNDPNNKNVVLLWADPANPGKLKAKYFSYDVGSPETEDSFDLTTYPRDGVDTAGMNITQGAPEGWDADDDSFLFMVGGAERHIGKVISNVNTSKQGYKLGFDADHAIGVRPIVKTAG